MDVVFKRTGARRYAVVVALPGRPAQAMDPAPGYDPAIPHDLVHYVVEATLGLTAGVYGRAARGAGTFIAAATGNPRELARARRKQQKRDLRLPDPDDELARSERLAAICDVTFRRAHGQRPDLTRTPPEATPEDTAQVERVVAQLERLAPLWSALPIDGALHFTWPGLTPAVV